MANNQFLTVGDVYNPLQTEIQLQAIQEGKLRNRIDAMKMKELYQRQARRDKLFNDPRGVYNFVAGQYAGGLTAQPQTAQPMPQAQPTPTPNMPTQTELPELSEEDRAAIRGQKKSAAILKNIQPLLTQAKNDPEIRPRVNQILKSMENSDDYQAMIKKNGFDNISTEINQETGEAIGSLEKYWTSEELEKRLEAPNGQLLSPIVNHPGYYRIKFNESGAVLGYSTYSKEEQKDLKNLTTSQWIDKSLHDPDPKERQRAREVLKNLGTFEAEKYATKYGGGATDEDYAFAAQIYDKTGKMPPLGRTSYGRIKVLHFLRLLREGKGGGVGSMIASQSSIKALQGSLGNVQKQENMMNSFVRNLNTQADRLQEILNLIGRTDARLLNVPYRKFKKQIKGSANEAILDMYLTEISSEIGKLATGSSASVAELSASARERWEDIHDPNLPISELYKLVQETQQAAQLRMESVRTEKSSILNEIESGTPAGSNRRSEPEQRSKPMKIGRFTVEVE